LALAICGPLKQLQALLSCTGVIAVPHARLRRFNVTFRLQQKNVVVVDGRFQNFQNRGLDSLTVEELLRFY
jgi:hypothetical protein